MHPEYYLILLLLYLYQHCVVMVQVCILIYLGITANFEESPYVLPEGIGSIAPKLTLTEPSPCVILVHVQLARLSELIVIDTYMYIHMYVCDIYG